MARIPARIGATCITRRELTLGFLGRPRPSGGHVHGQGSKARTQATLRKPRGSEEPPKPSAEPSNSAPMLGERGQTPAAVRPTLATLNSGPSTLEKRKGLWQN